MAQTRTDLTHGVQGTPIHPLDKMIAIAVRIAEREGLLLEGSNSVAEGGNEAVEDAPKQGRRTA